MRERIDSASNRKIKLAASLRQKKYREKEGLFLAEGVRLCEMAAHSGWRILFGLYTEAALADERARILLEELEGRGCRIHAVPEGIFAKASATDSPQGVLLVLEQKKSTLEECMGKSGQPLLMVLDGIQDPGNAGTMIRTADAAGVDGVIFLEGSADVFADKTVRATMGSLFHLPVCTDAKPAEFLELAGSRGFHLYAAALDETAMAYHMADFSGKAAVIFGNEAKGIGERLLGASKKIYIPMFGRAESLNVSAAAAVVVYEAVRQRRLASPNFR